MTSVAWIALAVAAVAAVADWVAVWRRPSPRENLLKPLVLVALIVVALAVHPEDGAQRAWFVVALVLSLAGDVFLLPDIDRFVPGLASFLLAHVAYVVGFLVAGRGDLPLALMFVVLVGMACMSIYMVRVVAAAEPGLVGPVAVYSAVITTMVGAAFWHGDATGTAGAVFFAMSDTTLASDRFVRSVRWMPLYVMVTYHLAQAMLVLSLLR